MKTCETLINLCSMTDTLDPPACHPHKAAINAWVVNLHQLRL